MESKKAPTDTPQTLLEAIRYFADVDVATAFVAKLRWPDGPRCPRCDCDRYSYLTTRRLWKCKNRECRYQYSAKKGTIFEDSPLGFDKWLPAVWLVTNAKNGISSHELARALGVHQESAWHMLHRVRVAMELGTFEKLTGEVETDETYVGGRGYFMHKSAKKKYAGKRGVAMNKTPVMGLLERDGKAVAKVVPNTKRYTLHGTIHEQVEAGASVYSDQHPAYTGLEADYDHQVVDHTRAYVEGRVHVNGLENLWSLLKRSLRGTYVSVRPEHLQAYVIEQVLRYNEREGTDADRFATVLSNTEGKQLTYEQLTSK